MKQHQAILRFISLLSPSIDPPKLYKGKNKMFFMDWYWGDGLLVIIRRGGFDSKEIPEKILGKLLCLDLFI